MDGAVPLFRKKDSHDITVKKRTEKTEVRAAAREVALREIKEKIKKTKDQKKASENLLLFSAFGFARGCCFLSRAAAGVGVVVVE